MNTFPLSVAFHGVDEATSPFASAKGRTRLPIRQQSRAAVVACLQFCKAKLFFAIFYWMIPDPRVFFKSCTFTGAVRTGHLFTGLAITVVTAADLPGG